MKSFDEDFMDKLTTKMENYIEIDDTFSDVEEYIPQYKAVIIYNDEIIDEIHKKIDFYDKYLNMLLLHENNFKLLEKYSKLDQNEETCKSCLGVTLNEKKIFQQKYTKAFWRQIQSDIDYTYGNIDIYERLNNIVSSDRDSTIEFLNSNTDSNTHKKQKI